jgi:hypothetical protein
VLSAVCVSICFLLGSRRVLHTIRPVSSFYGPKLPELMCILPTRSRSRDQPAHRHQPTSPRARARRPILSGISPSTSSALPPAAEHHDPRRKLGIHPQSLLFCGGFHSGTATAAVRAPAESGREMAGGSCGVCKEAPSKYKCPACRTP